jgi:hypothetical protein
LSLLRIEPRLIALSAYILVAILTELHRLHNFVKSGVIWCEMVLAYCSLYLFITTINSRIAQSYFPDSFAVDAFVGFNLGEVSL